jgi:S1/P1 Nuclease/Metal binding domain of Ada
MRRPAHYIAAVALAVLLHPISVWAWGNDGHEIVAIIAADNLSSAAQSHVAAVFHVSAEKSAIARAMEVAATRPDRVFREEDPSTAQWHFIDICLQDQRADLPRRCPGRNCVTGKIDEYAQRLKEDKYDRWGADGDLAFLVHFVGDLHQPLHAANDADKGGNCLRVNSSPSVRNLHAAWDTTVVRRLEDSIDSGSPETTARALEQKYAGEKERDVWSPNHTDDIAWESNQIARSDIYGALRIPVRPCDPPTAICGQEPEVDLSSAYMNGADEIAGHQLAKAGFRLASLLNELWVLPVRPTDVGRQKNSAQVIPSKITAGQIVGNRRSKIYAWPGCETYDTMAPKNRVVFPTRDAAEQAGYRAAYNCR